MAMTPKERDQALILELARRTGKKPSVLATDAGLAASTLTRVVNGTHRLSIETVEKLQAHYPESFGDLGEMADADTPAYVEIEVLPSYAGMGGGGNGDGEPGRALLPRRLIEEQLSGRPENFLLIDVRGDSMVPAGYLHGDQILIDRRDIDPTQPGPFALYDGDAYVVKLVERVPRQRGRLRIFSANERYREYEIEETEARILGRPVWLGRAL